MVEPTGYTALDLIGFTDKGPYDPNANYVKNDLVHVGNSTWRCKIDDTTGITPTEGANWTIFIESATSLAGMSDVDLNNPTDDDGLVYDSTSQKWENVPIMTQAMQTKLGAKNKARITATTQTVDGITYTIDQSAGTVIASGSLAAGKTSSYLAIGKVSVVAGDILTGCPVGGGSSDYELVVFNSSQTARIATDIGNGVVATSTDANAVIGIYIRKNLSSAIRFEPMVRIEEYKDRTFAPYAMTNRELTEDVTGYEGISDYITPVTSGNSIETNNMVVDALGKLRIVHVTVKFSADVNSSVKVATAKAGSMPRSLIGFSTTTAGNAKSGYINTSGEIYVDYPRAGWTYGTLVYVAQ